MTLLRFVAYLAVFAVPAGVAALGSATLARSSREEWRLLAWVPVLPLVIWAPFIAWGIAHDATSHNLWPFELVIWATLSLILFIAFVGLRAVANRPKDDWRARRDRDRTRQER
jgi:hypothetical protein